MDKQASFGGFRCYHCLWYTHQLGCFFPRFLCSVLFRQLNLIRKGMCGCFDFLWPNRQNQRYPKLYVRTIQQ